MRPLRRRTPPPHAPAQQAPLEGAQRRVHPASRRVDDRADRAHLALPEPQRVAVRGRTAELEAAQVPVRLAAAVEPMLTRTVAVPKQAFATRTTVRTSRTHYESIAARNPADQPERIVVVDDFVTSGATLLAACSRVAEVCPESVVLGFAAVRAMSDGDVDNLRAPVRGCIRKNKHDDRTRRRP